MLSEAGPTIERFLTGGVLELRDKLGPINWQLMPTTQFQPADLEGFLKLLPRKVEGRTLRHAIEVRHASFQVPEFADLAREYGVAIIVAGDSKYPLIADLTAPFVYARIMGTQPGQTLGYTEAALDQWGPPGEVVGQGRCGGRAGGDQQTQTPAMLSVTCFYTSSAVTRSPILPQHRL